MKRRNQGLQPKSVFTRNLLSVLIGSIFAASSSYAVPLVVKDPAGNDVVGYRWLLQEDTTKESVPGDPAVPGTHLSLSFHTSYAPVVSKGHDAPGVTTDIPLPNPSGRYYVSILPDSASANGGYSNGGAQIDTTPGATTKVTVNPLPFPTAQISVFIFEDNRRVNNIPDLPEEAGIPGFNLQLFEAGGSYGANGGRLLYDAFGNLLGTEYDAAHNPIPGTGTGVITTDANGVAVIKNLAPGKYTIFVTPRNNNTEQWVQTSTIEGTLGVDAWVKANEPRYFQEFGQPGHHVFIGFVKPTNTVSAPSGGRTITGRIVNQHMSRPPEYAFYDGEPVDRCWVGLNDAGGNMVYAQKCNPDSTFSIPNVPAGQYQLAIWDEPLDVLFASHTVTVPALDPNNPADTEVALNDVPVFNWFGRVKGQVFYDVDEDGFPDPGEVGIPQQAVNLRFRDGSIYQLNATDSEGTYEFHETFPFFNWLVAEVDFARFKATGVTVTVDAGGPIDPANPWSFDGTLNPQDQECTVTEQMITGCTLGPVLPYRTETGPVLTQGVQTFLGQSNAMEWGKTNYKMAAGENGGISGIVRYATTRAEDDPRYAAAENWEPGIPNVTVNLYRDADANGVPDGALIASVTTDSWDASLPAGCRGEVFYARDPATGLPTIPTDCFDGLRNFNQVRPAVFDGGYAFMEDPANPGAPLPPGTYIVEVVPPPGYEIVKEEDKNVDFGDTYVPAPGALPPVCVGASHTVPPELVLFPGVAAPFANQPRPLCDRKQVRLAAGQNAPADFFMYTEVPVAGQIVGMILNDLANEFDPNAPNFGEKYAPPHMPISIQDWTGREISRVYSDEYGTYNALVPSTYTINAPMPSGVSPNMLTACLNSPMKPNPAYNPAAPDPLVPQFIADQWFNPQYTQFCYTFQYMPGKTTYLDTPVLPIAAMTGPGRFPLDCEYGTATPMIKSVTNAANNGPWLPRGNAAQTLVISSMGLVQVPNPAWDGVNLAQKTIMRDYGFGAAQGTGKVMLGTTELTDVTWGNDSITAIVPATALRRDGTYQLKVIRDGGKATLEGVTVTVSQTPPIEVGAGKAYATIQEAIDAAAPGALITVAPGTYLELPIMYKPVQLQGWGPGATIINAVKSPAEKLQAWRAKINDLLNTNQFDLLPGQAAPVTPIDPANNEPGLFGSDEGAGITVVAPIEGPSQFSGYSGRNRARIDGFGITGSDIGGGIFVNGYANNLEIANNRIYANQGTYGGGIHVGNPLLVDGDGPTDSSNDNLSIHNNKISQNGSLDGAGGGISMYTGADNYQVTENYVCGNFAMGGGGGIAHLGRSSAGLNKRSTIARNTVIFNESFNQGQTVHGGGILIAGQPGLLGQLSRGSGNVTVEANLIQGNLAGAGDGGGIRTQFVNGTDVADTSPQNDSRVDLFDNIIVNNIAGLAGGGISMQDTVRIRIAHNTVANNDSTATAGEAFAPGSPNLSTAQPAGVVAHAHSPALAAPAALGCSANVPESQAWRCYSNPSLFANNIVWHNRSFYWEISNYGQATPACFGLRPNVGPSATSPGCVAPPANEAPVYADLGVLGGLASYCLKPSNSVLSAGTDTCGDASNTLTHDPLFVSGYVNTAPGQTVQQIELTSAISTAPAFDEGGNFIDVNFGPLSINMPVPDPTGALPDYHLGTPSLAVDRGSAAVLSQSPLLSNDIDAIVGQPRPMGGAPDAGADEAR